MKLMKKFLVFILLFMFIGIVHAESTQEGPFKLDWKTASEYQSRENVLLFNNNTFYKNGYVTTTTYSDDADDTDIPKTYINKYNVQGELQTTKTLENKLIIALTTNDESLIALSISNKESSTIIEILLLDESLDIQKEIAIDDIEIGDILNSFFFFKIYGLGYLNIIDNNVYFPIIDYIKGVNLETGDTTTYETTDRNMKKYLYQLYITENEMTDTKVFLGYDKKNNYEVLTGVDNQGCDIPDEDSEGIETTSKASLFTSYSSFFASSPVQARGCNPDYKGVIRLYNNDELVFDKIYDDYEVIYAPRIINDYIVTIAETESDVIIVVFDMEGNIIQEITDEEIYSSIAAGPAGFMTIGVDSDSGNRCDLQQGPPQQEGQILYSTEVEDPSCYKTNNIVYYLPLNIETKITGEGTINVVDKARSGEKITYKVTPKAGYVLDTIKVTDASGNVVEYKTNTFTMPSLDVTIEVTFKKDTLNPDTKDMALIVLVLALALGLGTLLINYKKLRFLK